MYRLSVCAETCFTHLPFAERAAKITSAGYLVEFWQRGPEEIDCLERLMEADPRVEVAAFIGGFEGSIMHPAGLRRYVEGLKARLPRALRLRCKRLMLVSGELTSTGAAVHPVARHPATRWITAYQALCEIAEIAEKHDVVYILENLNTVSDHPGYPLAHVEDIVALLDRVGSPRVRLLLDVYHVRMQGEDPVKAIRDCGPFIGHIHVADAPGRHEPGTGEIDWEGVARSLRDIEYEGVVGLEAFPSAGDFHALECFRHFFAVPDQAGDPKTKV